MVRHVCAGDTDDDPLPGAYTPQYMPKGAPNDYITGTLAALGAVAGLARRAADATARQAGETPAGQTLPSYQVRVSLAQTAMWQMRFRERGDVDAAVQRQRQRCDGQHTMQARMAAVQRQQREFEGFSSSVDTRAGAVRAPHMDLSSVMGFESAHDGEGVQQPLIRPSYSTNLCFAATPHRPVSCISWEALAGLAACASKHRDWRPRRTTMLLCWLLRWCRQWFPIVAVVALWVLRRRLRACF